MVAIILKRTLTEVKYYAISPIYQKYYTMSPGQSLGTNRKDEKFGENERNSEIGEQILRAIGYPHDCNS